MRTRRETSDTQTVGEALERYCFSGTDGRHIPDYVGFSGWIMAKIFNAKSENNLPHHASSASLAGAMMYHQLIREIDKYGIKITAQGPSLDSGALMNKKNTKSRLRVFNKTKLLLHLIKEVSAREREVLLTLQQLSSDGESTAAVRADASQAMHRVALFDALERRDINLAFKMLGRLREQDHDSGELEYLESLAYFYSNEFDKAVLYASSVPANSIDRPNANLIILESLAIQGKTAEFIERIGSAECLGIPFFSVMYLSQVMIRSAPEPVSALEKVAGIPQLNRGLEGRDYRGYRVFNRYSCNLAIQLVEHIKNFDMTKMAYGQAGPPIEEDQGNSMLPDVMLRIQAAISIDHSLVQEIAGVDIDDAYAVIVKRLINHAEHDMQDYIQALQTQWRIGDRGVFLQNIMRSLDQIGKQPQVEFQQILGWAYQEAVAQGQHNQANRIKPYLRDLPAAPARLDGFGVGSALERFERKLSPMGRLGLRAADAHLRHAELPENAWHDAGMVSLGFFRILELEINSQIVVPGLSSVDVEFMEKKLFEKRDAPGKAERKIFEFWSRMLPQIKKAKLQRKGLDLGALELLFRKLSVEGGSDKFIKDHLLKVLHSRLSDRGIEAVSSGELAELIREEVREKYRNPAAHARYVTLNTAQASKCYVLEVLEKLMEFVRQEQSGPTIH